MPTRVKHYCDCTPVVDVTYDRESVRTPSQAIVEGIATAADVDPTDLPPLQEQIDLEAIDRLFAGHNSASDPDAMLSFTVEGWKVFVRADGSIRICDPTVVTGPEPIFEATPAEIS